MAYKQSPANVLKGQMKNKAVGLAHGDSMAMQKEQELDNVDVTSTPSVSDKKKKALQAIQNQKDYSKNYKSTIRNLAESDSLDLVASGQGAKAQKMYGAQFSADKPQYGDMRDIPGNTLQALTKETKKILGPSPSSQYKRNLQVN